MVDMRGRKSNHKNHAYTLVDMMVFILLAGLAAVGAMQIVQHNLQTKRTNITVEHSQKIQEALESYIRHAGAAPCPANTSLNLGDAGFGVATNYNTDTKLCDDPSLVHQAGAVPVRTLHLKDRVIKDGWGNKFTYRISKYAGARVDFKDNPTYNSNIQISDINGKPLTHSFDKPYNAPVYVLISHGAKAKDATLNRGSASVDTENFVMTEMGNRAVMGNATHQDGHYYVGKQQGAYDDMVFFKRKKDFFAPKRLITPISMPQDRCQLCRMLLSDGRIDQVNSALASFIYNNPGSKNLAIAAQESCNQMIIACDNSPEKALEYTPPEDIVCANNGQFWHEVKKVCYETFDQWCEFGEEGFPFDEVCHETLELRCTVGEGGIFDAVTEQCYVNSEDLCDDTTNPYNNGQGVNYYNGICNFCPSTLTLEISGSCYASNEHYCDTATTTYNNGQGVNYYNGICNFCPSTLTYNNGGNCYASEEAWCTSQGKVYRPSNYNPTGTSTGYSCFNSLQHWCNNSTQWAARTEGTNWAWVSRRWISGATYNSYSGSCFPYTEEGRELACTNHPNLKWKSHGGNADNPTEDNGACCQNDETFAYSGLTSANRFYWCEDDFGDRVDNALIPRAW